MLGFVGIRSEDEKKDDWAMRNDTANRVVKGFDTKQGATKGGVFESAVGASGGSVKTQKENGRYQEERTYPGNRDPKSSKG